MDEQIKSLIGLIPAEKQAEAQTFFDQIKSAAKVTPESLRSMTKDPVHIPLFGELVKELAGRDEYWKYVSPLYDSRVSQAAEKAKSTFLEKDFPGLLEAEIKKRNPAKSTVEIELDELKRKLEAKDAESKRKDQVNLALKLSDGMYEGFNPELYIGENDDQTLANINRVKESYSKAIQAAVKKNDDEWLKKTGGAPIAGIDSGGLKNPFIIGSDYSVAKQTELYKTNKPLYDRFLAEASGKH